MPADAARPDGGPAPTLVVLRCLACFLLILASCVPVPIPSTSELSQEVPEDLASLRPGESVAVIAATPGPHTEEPREVDAAACLEARLVAGLPPGTVVDAGPLREALRGKAPVSMWIDRALSSPGLAGWAALHRLRYVVAVLDRETFEPSMSLLPGPIGYSVRRAEISGTLFDVHREEPDRAIGTAKGRSAGGAFAPLLFGFVFIPTEEALEIACKRLGDALAERLLPRQAS